MLAASRSLFNHWCCIDLGVLHDTRPIVVTVHTSNIVCSGRYAFQSSARHPHNRQNDRPMTAELSVGAGTVGRVA